ncbi:MAG: NADH-quinone oxidoreductase subunit N [Gemmatimonadales bacterium]|nr:MAG: NADH-quinone oxidoreductase subunit N [Gemmatimonadales bacterium]
MTLDFASNADYLWVLLPEIVLSVWAMVVLLAGVRRPDDPPVNPEVLGWLSLVGIALAAGVNGWLYGVTSTNPAAMITVDGFRLFSNWIFLLGAALTILIAPAYVARQRLQAGEFYTLILLATVGMMFMGGTRNLILLFLALETMSIAAYVLTAYNRRDRRSAEGGLKYFLLGSFSSGFLLYGIALVWGATGSVHLPEIGATVEAGAGFTGLLLAGMALLAIGFAFKVAAVPFHMWTPDVYEGAPSPATAFMAAAVKAASFVAFVRVFMEAFPALYESWYPIMWWLAAFTMVIANVVALSQSNVKRMLAYSSVAHGGYLLVALAAANQMAMAGLLFYLLVYTVMTVGAFGVLMVVAHHGEDRLQVEDYAGFGAMRPLLAVLFTIFLLSLAGFPGTAGFMAKIYLLQGAVDSQLWTLSILLVLTTVVSYYYYLRVAWFMWMRPAPEGQVAASFWAPLPLKVALVAGAGIILYLGIFPGGLLDEAMASAEGLGLARDVFLGLRP